MNLVSKCKFFLRFKSKFNKKQDQPIYHGNLKLKIWDSIAAFCFQLNFFIKIMWFKSSYRKSCSQCTLLCKNWRQLEDCGCKILWFLLEGLLGLFFPKSSIMISRVFLKQDLLKDSSDKLQLPLDHFRLIWVIKFRKKNKILKNYDPFPRLLLSLLEYSFSISS